jgi:hypothetical protein
MGYPKDLIIVAFRGYAKLSICDRAKDAAGFSGATAGRLGTKEKPAVP